MSARTEFGRPTAVLATLGIGWAGLLIHDVAEFGSPSSENAIPFGVGYLLLALAWLARPGRLIVGVTLAFGALVLLASALSVIPLDLWPWDPEQTLDHYAVHVLAAAAQVPLLIAAPRQQSRLSR